MYGNKKKHPSVLIRSAVFLFFSGKQKKKKLQVTCLDRTNIHSNYIIETGVMRWTTTVKLFRDENKKDIWIIDGNGTRAHTGA